jgi:hypothetical protein
MNEPDLTKALIDNLDRLIDEFQGSGLAPVLLLTIVLSHALERIANLLEPEIEEDLLKHLEVELRSMSLPTSSAKDLRALKPMGSA